MLLEKQLSLSANLKGRQARDAAAQATRMAKEQRFALEAAQKNEEERPECNAALCKNVAL